MKISGLIPKMLGLAAITAGALAIAAYYWQTAGGTLPFAGHRYQVSALVGDAQELLKHADVRAAGVPVGQVSAIDNQGPVTKVQMSLDSAVTPLYRNATVLVRQKTLVGENYIEVNRGTPTAGPLPDGATLPASADQAAVPLDKILNSLDGHTRTEIRRDLAALGGGLAGHGVDLNATLGALQPTLDAGSTVLGVLDAQRRQVADVVQNTGTVLQAIGDRSSDLQSLVGEAKTTAQAVAARDAAFQASLAALPPTLRQARGTVARLSSFSARATPVVTDLRTALTTLRPVVADLTPTAVSGRRLFDALTPLTRVAPPLLTQLRAMTSKGSPALTTLDDLLRQAVPALDYLKPYNRDVGGLLANFGASREFDRYGEIGRCTCPVGPHSFANYTPAEEQILQAMVHASGIDKINNLISNPVKKPGQLPVADIPFLGAYPHVTAEAPHK